MGDVFDRLAASPAWLRLQERSPVGADPFTVGIKHDLMNVLMALAAVADEAHTAAVEAKAVAAKLERQLYDPKEGDFVGTRDYTDKKFARFSTWLSTVGGGAAVALIAYLINSKAG